MSKNLFFTFLTMSTATLININEMFSQPKEYVYYNGTDITWFKAVELCEAKGGSLATFDSVHDHMIALKRLPMDARVWIGYSDLQREGMWKTVNNEIPDYMKWIQMQPDDRFRDEDCALLVMGPWGRGMFMDADCNEPTGIKEWTIPASYMCRFDGPKRALDPETGRMYMKAPEDKDPASWATTPAPTTTTAPAPQVIIGPTFNDTAMREIETDIAFTQDQVSDNTRQLNVLKSNLSDYTYDLQMITNSTAALKNDNKLIFEQMNNVLEMVKTAQVAPAHTQQAHLLQTVTLKSSVEQEEGKFFEDHQRTLNKQIFSGLNKQKDQIRKIKLKLGTAEIDEGVDIDEFVTAQKDDTKLMKAQIKKLTMELLLLKRHYESMKDHVVELRNKLASG